MTLPPATLRFLMIDDDRSDVARIEDCLKDGLRGAPPPHVEQARSVDQALSCLTKSRYDVLLIDFRIGTDDGMTVLRRVRDSGIDTPAICLGDRDGEEIVPQALRAGFEDCVSKSSEKLARLPSAVLHALARVEQHRALEEAERRYRTLYEAAPVGLLQSSREGAILGA